MTSFLLLNFWLVDKRTKKQFKDSILDIFHYFLTKQLISLSVKIIDRVVDDEKTNLFKFRLSSGGL